jgi:8-oxo-dGTP pyrophosphatase MutT (NUDIX family)
MSASNYVDDLRKKVGKDLLLMPGVAAIIKDEKGKILIQKNKDGVWNLPAGAIDPGEKPAKAIVREIFEETGLAARPSSVAAVLGGAPEYRMKYPNGDEVEATTIVFACEVIGGEIKPQDDETATLKYVAVDQLPELATKLPPDFFHRLNGSTFFEWDETWLDEAQ